MKTALLLLATIIISLATSLSALADDLASNDWYHDDA